MKSFQNALLVAMACCAAASPASALLRGSRNLGAANTCTSVAGTPGLDKWCQVDCSGNIKAYPKMCKAGGAPAPRPHPVVTPAPTPATTVAPHTAGKASHADGKINGFFYGYATSAVNAKAPTSGWAFAFPGQLEKTPGSPAGAHPWDALLPTPVSQYDQKIYTFGGGGTVWDDDVYAQVAAVLPQMKQLGWDGVCFDWEEVGTGHTTKGFNKLLRAAKSAKLLSIVTSTAEGPYQWSAADKDATGIEWDLADYFLPQMYGGDAKALNYAQPAFHQYLNYWKLAGTAPQKSIHGVTFRAPAAAQFLWGIQADPASQNYVAPDDVLAMWPETAGTVLWDYSPNNK